jgi:hypothetical protein
MPLTRRQLLRAAGIVPIGLTVSALVAHAGEIIHSTAAALRPSGSGTSATRCAQCGGDGHSMLDPRCPAARKVV